MVAMHQAQSRFDELLAAHGVTNPSSAEGAAVWVAFLEFADLSFGVDGNILDDDVACVEVNNMLDPDDMPSDTELGVLFLRRFHLIEPDAEEGAFVEIGCEFALSVARDAAAMSVILRAPIPAFTPPPGSDDSGLLPSVEALVEAFSTHPALAAIRATTVACETYVADPDEVLGAQAD